MDGPRKLLIVGFGNMTGAMLAGWLAAGYPPSRFAVLNRSMKPVPDGVSIVTDPGDVGQDHDAVLLGFKPHQLDDLAPGLQTLANDRPVYSVLAGKTCAQLKTAFPRASERVRAMPNLASRINKSPIILTQAATNAAGREPVTAFFAALGEAVWLEDESQYDLATALAGSGPGFVYRFIDALARAGESLGLEEPVAGALALSMVEGAASLAAQSELTPAQLADQVASPGGMTREGLNVLDRDRALERLLEETLRDTRDRGAVLSAGQTAGQK